MIMWENTKSTHLIIFLLCYIFSWLSVDFAVHETFRNTVLENVAAALWKKHKAVRALKTKKNRSTKDTEVMQKT